MFKDMKIHTKLIVVFLLVGLGPLATMGWITLSNSRAALQAKAMDQLISFREAKKSQIEDYVRTVEQEARTFSNDRMVIDAVRQFSAAFKNIANEGEDGNPVTDDVLGQYRQTLSQFYNSEYSSEYQKRNGGDQSASLGSNLSRLNNESLILQYRYIAANTEPLGRKSAFLDANDGSIWSMLHQKYHPHLQAYLDGYDLSDILLCDAETGHIVYSVSKEIDFSTSLKDGPFAATGAGKAFAAAAASNNPGFVVVEDFAPYEPSYDDQSGFVASPIFDGSQKVGVLIFEMPIDQINRIMTSDHRWSDVGLGQTGETYLVGPDLRMRSDSRLAAEDISTFAKEEQKSGVENETVNLVMAKKTTFGLVPIESFSAREAINGRSGSGLDKGFQGEAVLAAYCPLDLKGLTWAIVAQIGKEEAFAAVGAMQRTALIVGVLAALGVVLLGSLFAKNLSGPIHKVVDLTRKMNEEFNQFVEVVDAISSNDLTRQVKQSEIEKIGSNSRDEIGMLVQAVEETISAKNQVGTSLNRMTSNLNQMVRQLSLNAAQLVSTANEIASSSEQMSKGAQDQSNQVGSVSTAIEEMLATIVESSKNAADATDASRNASNTASAGGEVVGDTISGMQKIAGVVRESAQSIGKLAQSADEIGAIIKVIDDIADQTNLLALNAAIEAARAGEQGRGFAVVADEVRKLAERTGKATGEITQMIKGIQQETVEAVQSMQTGIDEVDRGRQLADKAGGSLNEIVVMSQRVMDMIQQIATAAEEQSSAAEQISKNIEHISSVTRETASGAQQSAAAAEELNRQAEALKTIVGQFKTARS